MSKKSPVWISRPLLNTDDVFGWLHRVGVRKVMPADQLHMTLATVREPVDWSYLEPETNELVVPPGLKTIQIFAWTIKALTFGHPAIKQRHDELLALLPMMDHPILRPHVSLYKGGRMPNASMPYDGELVFGPERIVPFDAAGGIGIKHVKVADLVTL